MTFRMDIIRNDLTVILFHLVLNCQLSLDLYYTEDEIYELSYTKEPKNPKIQVSLTQGSLKFTVVTAWFHTRRDVLELCSLWA